MYYFFLLMDFYNHVVMRRSTKWDILPSRTTQCHKSRQKHKKWFRHMVIIFTKSKHTFRTNSFNFQSLQQWRRIQTHFPTDDRGRCKKWSALGVFNFFFMICHCNNAMAIATQSSINIALLTPPAISECIIFTDLEVNLLYIFTIITLHLVHFWPF
jgi:hypothetical protein